MNWRKFSKEKPPQGQEVLAYNRAWINEDFNPKGVRIGFTMEMKISHSECDDNQAFSDQIKNNIEPELWAPLDYLTDYLPD